MNEKYNFLFLSFLPDLLLVLFPNVEFCFQNGNVGDIFIQFLFPSQFPIIIKV
jgi:hypothetical protein